MPGRIVRSKTAERVAELLGSRDGRRHLSRYGWAQGMPVIIAQPHEPAEDVMALVSVHNCPVLVAMLDTPCETLRFIHVSPPNAALEIVDELPRNTRTRALFDQSEGQGMLSFRVRYWKYSAVANAVPVYTPETQQSMEMPLG
ncbi:hypothetical protein FQA45_09670 [Glutamicibacter halophytocola]|uniref:Uncharacterized protein n=1 Tax=Glutamicibacter halophytocola TaxID=1933880 RepID=A0ABX5YA59_9MICC|nr:hypothetical protein [Glutamicibacter sp. FBE19]QDY66572.1 hypothetical protein FQA45_09670 [Glutamicibacter halophytocola]